VNTGVGRDRSITEQPRSVTWEIEELVIRIVIRWRCELAMVAVPVGLAFGIARLLGWSRTAWIAGGMAAVALASVMVLCPPVRRRVAGMLFTSRQRRRLHRAWQTIGVSRVADRPPRVETASLTGAGVRLVVRLAPGTQIGDVEQAAEVVAASLGVRSVRAVRDPDRADRVVLSIQVRDPFGSMAHHKAAGLPDDHANLWSSLSLGIDEDGNDVRLGLGERSLLIGGLPGGGKSGVVNLVVATAALDPRCRLWLFDGKIVELAPYRAVSHQMVGPDMTDAIAVLDELRVALDERFARLASQRLRRVNPEGGFELVVVDELALYCAHPDRKAAAAFSERLRDLVARGRAAGVVVVAATQKPSSEVVPTALRDLFGFRVAMRCSSPEMSDTVLGSGMAAAGHSSTTIDSQTAGVGLLLAEGGTPRPFRSHWLDDAAIDEVVARAAILRASTRDGAQ
jgi:hypothetical protein